MTDRFERYLQSVEPGDVVLDAADASRLAQLAPSAREQVILKLMERPLGRRWLRASLLSALEGAEAGRLAVALLEWRSDFAPHQRDRTTAGVVDALPVDRLLQETPFLAGSNAASHLWERLARVAPEQLTDLALRVLAEADAVGRETMLHLVLLDPFGPVSLTEPERLAVLAAALADDLDEIRGLAADLMADEAPDHLLAQRDHWLRDSSERVRTAAWDVAFAHDPDGAATEAVRILFSEAEPLAVKRTALLALGHALPTAEIAPLLASMVAHPERELAEDAANLLWSLHRSPEIAEAASRSPHAGVRALAQRLLHPELGSPAAGGSRPGAPVPVGDIYQQMLKGYEGARADSEGPASDPARETTSE